MKEFLAIILSCMVLLNFSCNRGTNSIGFEDDFSNSDGWVEVSSDKDTIPPSLKMESKEGSLIIHHKFRILEGAYKNFDWVENRIDYSTNLRKNYGELDLNKYHYSVYCGNSEDFKCNNETVVRSVLKTSVTDVVPENPYGLYYKVIAVDNRWNESEPATIRIR